MAQPPETGERGIRVHTTQGVIEGSLLVNDGVRTSDHLNLAGRSFLDVRREESSFPRSFGPGSLAVARSCILFITETGDLNPRTDSRIEASRFSRVALRLRVGDYDVQGFLHVPVLSSPMKRLTQNRQPFVAFTAASVVGPDTEFATAFLAVNVDHLLAVQEIEPADTARSEDSELDMAAERAPSTFTTDTALV
jgi:hypothetical protein